MTEIPTVPVSTEETAAFDRMRTDAVSTGRAMSSGQFLAGLIADAQLATAGRPERLAADLFPDFDPVMVQVVWDRALAVGLHAGRMSATPRLYRDEMDRIAGALEAAGFEAMGMSVRRSRALVAPERDAHPVDSEIAREH